MLRVCALTCISFLGLGEGCGKLCVCECVWGVGWGGVGWGGGLRRGGVGAQAVMCSREMR